MKECWKSATLTKQPSVILSFVSIWQAPAKVTLLTEGLKKKKQKNGILLADSGHISFLQMSVV